MRARSVTQVSYKRVSAFLGGRNRGASHKPHHTVLHPMSVTHAIEFAYVHYNVTFCKSNVVAYFFIYFILSLLHDVSIC